MPTRKGRCRRKPQSGLRQSWRLTSIRGIRGGGGRCCSVRCGYRGSGGQEYCYGIPYSQAMGPEKPAGASNANPAEWENIDFRTHKIKWRGGWGGGCGVANIIMRATSVTSPSSTAACNGCRRRNHRHQPGVRPVL